MADLRLDEELRAAVFARTRQLRDRFGDRIPRDELSEGVSVRNQRVPLWNYQRGIYKPQILGRDGAALSIQTSAESPYADSHDPDSGHFVYKYRGTDPNYFDNAALRRAMWAQRPLLYLVGVDPGFYDAVFPVYVTGEDQEHLQFALMADQADAWLMPGDPSRTPIRREYVTRAVMQRLHQQQFRRLVLNAYRERCSICKLGHVELLDAAHILPDRDPRGEPLVSNGLGLCKIHHCAYDTHILGIDPDARVHIRLDILEEVDGPMLRHGLQAVHHTRLILPRQREDQPNRDFLSERFKQFLAA